MLKNYIKAMISFVLHCGMMFLGAVINLKQTRTPKTLKLINIVATVIYATWLLTEVLNNE